MSRVADIPAPEAPTRSATTQRLARLFGGFAVGSVSVVLLAILLYVWRSDTRRLDLEAHYARQSARVARQVELRLTNYRQQADALFRKGESAKTAKRVPKLELASCEVAKGSAVPFALLSGDRSALLFPNASQVDARGQSSTGECLRLALAELLTGLAGDQSDVVRASEARRFDELALLDEAGNVLAAAHARSSRVRVQRLPDFKDALPNSQVTTLRVGSDEYRAFLQPLTAPSWRPIAVARTTQVSKVLEVATGPRLNVTGLVHSDRLRADSRQVNPAYFLWAVFVLAVGLLSLPLAKLWLLSPVGRFRRLDAAFLMVSAVLGAALGVALVLGFLARVRMREDLEARLRLVGTQLAVRIEQETAGAAEVLERIITYQGEASALGCSGVLAADIPKKPENNDAEESTKRIERRCPGFSLARYGVAEDLRWNTVFWVDESGEQRLKYMPLPESRFTPFVNLSERSYFRRALAQETETIADEHGKPLPAAAEIVRSVTTGDTVLVLARPTYGGPTRDGDSPSGVLGFETKLTGLVDQVLPLGFQTAIVDANGKVMLHSDNDAHHGQMLFDDLESASELRALNLARLPGILNVEYLGSRSHLYSRPVPGNWSVIVMADSALVDVPTRYMIMLTLGMLGALGLTCALCVLLFAIARRLWRDLLRPGRAGSALPAARLFQPDASKSGRYLREGLWTLGGSALVTASAFWATPGLPMYAALGMCLVLLLSFLATVAGRAVHESYRLARKPRTLQPAAPPPPPTSGSRAPNTDKTFRLDVRFGYALRCVGLTTALASAPSAVIFACAYDELSEGIARVDQDHYARQLRHTPECFESARCREHAVFGLSAPAEKRSSRQAGLHTAGLSAPLKLSELLQAGYWQLDYDAAWAHPVRFVLDRLPPFPLVPSDAAGRLYRVPPPAPDRPGLSWGWKRQLEMLDLQFGSTTKHRVQLSPVWVDRPNAAFAGILLGVSVAVFVLCFLAYESLHRLLFLDLLSSAPAKGAATEPDKRVTYQQAWESSSPDERRLLAQLAIDGYVAPHPKNSVTLRSLAKRALIDPATLTLRSAALAEVARERFSVKDLKDCEVQGGSNAWTLVRAPLTTGVGLLLLCLGFTQPDLTAAGLTIPSALSLIPLLVRLFIGKDVSKA